jgi:hypothetical protein
VYFAKLTPSPPLEERAGERRPRVKRSVLQHTSATAILFFPSRIGNI